MIKALLVYQALLVLTTMTQTGVVGAYDPAAYHSSLSVNDQILFRWTITGSQSDPNSTIDFAIEAMTTAGWIGIGIPTPLAGMPGADIGVAFIDDATQRVTMQDMYAIDYATPMKDPCGPELWIARSYFRNATTTVVEGSRKLVASDTLFDRTIAQSSPSDPGVKMIFALGFNQDFYFHATATDVQVNLFQLPDLLNLAIESGANATKIGMVNHALSGEATEYNYSRCFTPRDVFSTSIIDSGTRVFAEAIAASLSSNYVHHMIFMGFRQTDLCQGPPVQLFAGGSHSVNFAFPRGTALELSKYGSFIVQMHYNNPSRVKGARDSSGVTIYWTANVPTSVAALLVLGDGAMTLAGVPLPNGLAVTQFSCPSSCTEQQLPPSGITVISSALHMHKQGVWMRSQYVNSSGDVFHEVADPFYDFQKQRNLLLEPFTVKRGDSITTTCIHNGDNTKWGFGTSDEMCMDFVYYTPALDSLDQLFCSNSFCGGAAPTFTLVNSSFIPRAFGIDSMPAHSGQVCEALPRPPLPSIRMGASGDTSADLPQALSCITALYDSLSPRCKESGDAPPTRTTKCGACDLNTKTYTQCFLRNSTVVFGSQCNSDCSKCAFHALAPVGRCFSMADTPNVFNRVKWIAPCPPEGSTIKQSHPRDYGIYQLAMSPELLQSVINNGADFEFVAVPAFSVLIVCWLLRELLRGVLFQWPFALRRHSPHTAFGQMNQYQQEVFVQWIMQLLFSTIGAIICYSLSYKVLLYGTFQDSLLRNQPDTSFDRPPMWTASLARSLITWRWAFQPMLLLYLFEVVSVSPARESSVSHRMMTFHHLLVILMATFIFKAFSTTLDPRWAQMGFVLYQHMTLEQHSWLALIVHRLQWPYHRHIMFAATGIETVVRLLLWGFAFYVYATLCWMRCVLTYYELAWQASFPVLSVLMITAQVQIVRIHIALATRKEPARVIQPPPTNATKDEPPVAESHSTREPVKDPKSPTRPEEDRIAPNGTTLSSVVSSGPLLSVVALALLTLVSIGLLYGADIVQPAHTTGVIKGKRIAVVGAGAAGLAATYALMRDGRFDVTLIEQRARLGGAAYTVYHEDQSMDMAVHHMYNFNNVEMFLNEIGMPLDDDFAGEAVIQNISGVATTLDSFFPIHGLPWEHFRSEITRFGKLLRDAEARWSEHDLATVTVNQFLADNLFPATFFRAVQFSLYKLSSAAASIAQLDMPVGLFAYIDRRTGITTKSRQRAYRQVVPNGTYSYVLRLADIFSDSPHVRVLTETTVNAVKHSEFGEVSLLMQHVGNGADFHSFDQVIFAIPKEQLSAVFFSSQSTSTGADNVYRYIFGAVSYTPVNIAAHTDSSLIEEQFGPLKDQNGCWRLEMSLLYYNPRISPYASGSRPPFELRAGDSCITNISSVMFGFADFDTYSPSVRYPDPAKVIERIVWRQPQHNLDFFKSARAQHAIQGRRRMWFAGGEVASFNSHEAAFTSGLVAANAVGASYPFDRNEFARLFFLQMRSHMFGGSSYILAHEGAKGTSSERCERCL